MVTKTDDLLLNRYKILSRLGRGGFADVYKAFDTRMERTVAIKQIAVNRHSAERVLREARTVALLNHPNIVTIHEFEEDGDDCYLIMELIDGVPLSKILGKISPLAPHEAIAVTIEICKALEAAHHNGIIHRDIKPENIMVLYDGRLKVMDFGIARLKGTSTTSDDIIGTFAYMSPEQARGEVVDERSDIYSLGIVLYEMLTDCIPFGGESAVETLNMVQNVHPAPPSKLNSSLNEAIDICVMIALAKNAKERYASAAALREKLEYVRGSSSPPEKILSGLVARYMDIENDLGWDIEGTGWRARFWRFIYEHEESIKRTPAAVFFGYPFLPILHYWYGWPRTFSLFIGTAIYLSILLRPEYGLGLTFLALSIVMAKYSTGLFLVMLFSLIPYWALVSRRWPMLSVSPVAGAILGLIQVPFVFPILTGLLTGPIIAAPVAALGCIAFELLNIFLRQSTMPELMNGYGVWSAIKDSSSLAYVVRLLVSPFLEDRVLLLQPVLWALVAAITSIIKGKRRWFFGTVSGFVVLIMGYQGLLTELKGSAFDVGELMQGLSFSLIILLLLPIFRPPARSEGTGHEVEDELTE